MAEQPHDARSFTDRDPTRDLQTDQVLAYLLQRGRRISAPTWRAYVGRNQAPPPVRKVGRTPLWSVDDLDEWLNDPRRRY